MRILILANGHAGSTVRAGQLLARWTGADFCDSSCGRAERLERYDLLILGTNIRMGRVNRRYAAWAKRWKKQCPGRPVHAYVTAADAEKAQAYIRQAKEHLLEASCVVYAGGELDESKLKWPANIVARSAAESLKAAGKPLPGINEEALWRFTDEIAQKGK